MEAVHLLASFASLEAKLSQLCSNVRQPCLIMGKAAPALRQVSQKLRHWRKSLHTCVKPCDRCRKYVVICVNDATFATPVARLAQPCPGWGKHDADHYIAASALACLATSLANDASRWTASKMLPNKMQKMPYFTFIWAIFPEVFSALSCNRQTTTCRKIWQFSDWVRPISAWDRHFLQWVKPFSCSFMSF